MVEPLWETDWPFLKSLNIELLYDPEVPIIRIYAKEMKTYIHLEHE